MANRQIESLDPRSFNIENLPQRCGNEVFETVEEYREIEAIRLRKAERVESTTQTSHGADISNGNGTNGSNGNGGLSSYIPQLSDPVKILCVKAHIFRDSAGQGHFQKSDAWRVTRLFEWGTWRYSNPNPPSDMPNPPPPFLVDSRIRFKLTDRDVAFYDDTALHTTTSIAALQAAAVAQNPKTLDYLNVYFTAGSMGGAAAFATLPSTATGYDSWVVMLGSPYQTSDPNFNMADWASSGTLAHELGHVVDLMHTYLGGGASAICTIGPDFLYDVFG